MTLFTFNREFHPVGNVSVNVLCMVTTNVIIFHIIKIKNIFKTIVKNKNMN